VIKSSSIRCRWIDDGLVDLVADDLELTVHVAVTATTAAPSQAPGELLLHLGDIA